MKTRGEYILDSTRVPLLYFPSLLALLLRDRFVCLRQHQDNISRGSLGSLNGGRFHPPSRLSFRADTHHRNHVKSRRQTSILSEHLSETASCSSSHPHHQEESQFLNA